MAKPWIEVENSKAYLSLDSQSQEAAKQEYFNTVVSVKPEFLKLPDPEKEMARSEFFGKDGITNAVGMANGVTTLDPVTDFALGGMTGFASRKNSQELMDVPRVIGRQLPGMRGFDVDPVGKAFMQGPANAAFDAGLYTAEKLGGKQLSAQPVIQPPRTAYGKSLETGADVLPLLALGGYGISKLSNRLSNRFGKKYGPALPTQLELDQSLSGMKSELGQLSGAEQKFKKWNTQINSNEAKNLASLRRQELSGIKGNIESVDASAQKTSASRADLGREKYWEFYKGLLKKFSTALDESGFTKEKIASSEAADLLEDALGDLNIDTTSGNAKLILDKVAELRSGATTGKKVIDSLTNRVVSEAKPTEINASSLWDFLKKQTSNDYNDPAVNRVYKALSNRFKSFSEVAKRFKPEYQDNAQLYKTFGINTASKTGDVNINTPFDFLYKIARGKADESDKRIIGAIERRFGKDFIPDLMSHAKSFSKLGSDKQALVENYAKKVSAVRDSSAIREADFMSRVSGKRRPIESNVGALEALKSFVMEREKGNLAKSAKNQRLARVAGKTAIGVGALGAGGKVISRFF